MLIGKSTGANRTGMDAARRQRHMKRGKPAADPQIRAGQDPKISVRPPPVRIWQALKVTKWSINSGDSNVSDQQNQPASGETGTLGTGPTAPDMPASNEPVAVAAGVETAELAPELEENSQKADAPKADAAGTEAPKVEE
jgi:hypothetical protein